MNESKILVHFQDSLVLFNSKTFEKISEIPGDFDKCEFALSESAIVYSRDKTLMFIDSVGTMLFSFEFQSEIRSISSSSYGVIVGCIDGTISFIINKKSHFLVQHNSSVEWVERKDNQVAIIDRNSHCFIYDSFKSSILNSIDFSTSFAFNDCVTDLYASSNGSTISVYYKNCKPINHFVEGNLLAFVENNLIVSNRGAIEVIQTNLPYEELIQKGMWDDVCNLIFSLESLKFRRKQKQEKNDQFTSSDNNENKNKNEDQNDDDNNNSILMFGSDSDSDSEFDFEDYYHDLILDECIKRKSFEIAPLLINRSNKSQSFLFAEILPNSPESSSVYLSNIDEKSGNNDPKLLEESGDSYKALDSYAANGDWNSVLRLASSDSSLARQMADFSLPHEYASQEAKILLKFGFSDSAIRVLSNSEDLVNLAKTHVYLGYPKMSQLLFESNLWFESLVCLFVVNDYDIRFDTIKRIDSCVTTFNQHKFINLMRAFNEPEQYWTLLDLSSVYLCLDNLSHYSFMLPLSIDDAIDVFYMCHFICARYKVTPIGAVEIGDILVHFLFSAAILGLKRWVSFTLKEIMQLDLDENIRRIAQLAALRSKETQPNEQFINNKNNKCSKCGAPLFSSGKIPLLVCGACGMKIAFSAFSGKPLPLIHISYNGKKNPVELIQIEPKGNQNEPELTTEFVSDEFLEKAPSEKFVIQKIKKAAGIQPQLWLNPNLESFHVCNICGTLMDDVDYEKSILDNDFCPICKGNESYAEENQILAALRTFEPDSPILF